MKKEERERRIRELEGGLYEKKHHAENKAHAYDSAVNDYNYGSHSGYYGQPYGG